MVSTHLKNYSQNGSFLQVGVKIKNIWNKTSASSREVQEPIFVPKKRDLNFLPGNPSGSPPRKPSQANKGAGKYIVVVLWNNDKTENIYIWIRIHIYIKFQDTNISIIPSLKQSYPYIPMHTPNLEEEHNLQTSTWKLPRVVSTYPPVVQHSHGTCTHL